MRQNITAFALVFGVACGLLTVTFAEDISTREAQRRIANFRRRVLKAGFGKWITVREFAERGRPHFHILIDCRGDISTGFDFEYQKAVTAWSKGGRVGPKPQGSLNRTAHLAALHALLLEKGPLYGIGRMELVPIEKVDAIGFYLGKYLGKSLAHKPDDAKRTRSLNYSQGCPRVFKGRFSWANPFGWVWRAKLRKWATKHGCATMKEVAALFGPKWAYHHREAILATKLHWYPTAKHAHADGLTVADDAVGIRIGTWVNDAISYAEAESEGAPADLPDATTTGEPSASGSDLSEGEGKAGGAAVEKSEYAKVRIYVLKRRDVSVAAGLAWAKRASDASPSLVDELYPEYARIQKERRERGRQGFDCAEIPRVDEPF